MNMRKLLMVGGALLASALMLTGAFAKGGINNTVVSIAPGTVAAGGGGGGGGGKPGTFIVFGFATTDAANAALAANPGLVGLTPDPNSLFLPVQIAIPGAPRP